MIHLKRWLAIVVAIAVVALCLPEAWHLGRLGQGDDTTLPTITLSSTAGPGCGLPQPPGRFRVLKAGVAGRDRSYEINVPVGYTGDRPLPLVFGYHGAGGRSRDAMGWGVAEAAGSDAIVVAPQGIEFGDHGVGWDTTCGGYDMQFFDQIVADVAANYCVDTERIHAFGHSWGADFATALACCRGDRLRAIASNAATDEFTTPTDWRTYKNLQCPTRSEAALRFTHSADGDEAYPAPYFATTSDLYRAFNGCPNPQSSPKSQICTTFEGCRRPVVECAYPDLGHDLPAGFGRDTWEFFQKE